MKQPVTNNIFSPDYRMAECRGCRRWLGFELLEKVGKYPYCYICRQKLEYEEKEKLEKKEKLIARRFPNIPKVPSQVLRLLEALPNRLKLVVILRQGFDRQESRTLEEVGRHLGVTRERIRQLYREAINRLVKEGNDLKVNIPLYSCECGKYQGLRYRDIWCDKCGTKLIYRGHRKFNLKELALR